MPVARSERHAGKALLVAGVGVGLALGLAFLMAVLANRGDVTINLGDPRFDAGRAENQAARIERDGGFPLPYADLVGGDRPIYVQHLGATPEEGWVAFLAVDPADPTCTIEVDEDERALFNACDPSVTYPLSGEGLRHFPTTVENGRILVDINEISTTTTPTGTP